MERQEQRRPIACAFYETYLEEGDCEAFAHAVAQHYTVSTLQRLAESPDRAIRRAAVLALGLVGSYETNSSLGRALSDADRGVRTLAETGIRQVWRRAGTEQQRERLEHIVALVLQKRYEEAIRASTMLIEAAPWFAEVWNQRAIAHYHRGRYVDSIRDCRQALEINPYHFAAAAGMGQCHLKLNDYAAALECFRRALRLNPNLESVRAQVVYLQRLLKGE